MKLLDLLGTFDYITPTVSLIGQARGKTVIVAVDDFDDIDRVKAAGIKVSHVSYNAHKKCWLFDVPTKDQDRVRHIL